MKQNEQIEGDAFFFFQSWLKQHPAKLSRLGRLWGKRNRLNQPGESDMEEQCSKEKLDVAALLSTGLQLASSSSFFIVLS